jgi:membrane protease YdiL (CAAX protease family)
MTTERTASPLPYFILVSLLAIPCWVSGSARLLPPQIPIALPVAALGAFVPLTAALILAARAGGWAEVKSFVGKALDPRRITSWRWVAVAIAFMPVVMVLDYLALRLVGAPLPKPQIAWGMIPGFFAMFLLGAVGEEMGWQAWAFPRLAAGRSAFVAAVLLGLFWAAWHVGPYLQTGRSPLWIALQCLTTVLARILISWLYCNNRRSVLIGVLFHAMINVSEFLFPNFGSHYDPAPTALFQALAVVVIAAVWGPSLKARG